MISIFRFVALKPIKKYHRLRWYQTGLSFANAHDVRHLSATLTDILSSVGGSSPDQPLAGPNRHDTNTLNPATQAGFSVFGRSDWIRTSDFYVPKRTKSTVE